MIVAWPWAALAPLNPLRAMTAFADFHYQIKTFLDGHVYYMADVPRWYVPTYMAIKLTFSLLVGAALALAFAMLPQGARRGQKRSLPQRDHADNLGGVLSAAMRRDRRRSGI